MKIGLSQQSASYRSPELDGFELRRRPFLGFGLLVFSVVAALAVLIYLGAWASSDQIENRALAAGVPVSHADGKWLERGLLLACPLH